MADSVLSMDELMALTKSDALALCLKQIKSQAQEIKSQAQEIKSQAQEIKSQAQALELLKKSD